MRRIAGYILTILGSLMFVPPQANLGVKELRWMHDYAFPGEVLAAILILSVGLFLLDIKLEAKER
jgi:hypothetical protein